MRDQLERSRRARKLFGYVWVKLRMSVLIFNGLGLMRLKSRINSISKPVILFVLSDNAFQSPKGRRLSHRHLEVFFRLLDEMNVDCLIVRPLFGKRIFKLRTEKIYSAESLSLWPIISAIFGHASHVEATWMALLGKIQPSLVVGQNLSLPLLGVCAKLKINTAEVQHGVWFDNQLAIFDFNIAELGSTPTFFLTWHKFYEEMMSHGISKAITIGYPSRIGKEPARKTESEKETPIRVLVALSIGVVESVDPHGLIRPSIDRILKELHNYPCEVAIRPHPLTGNGHVSRSIKYRWIRRNYPGTKVIGAHEQSILTAMSESDVVITFDGTIVIDAVLQGKIVLHTSEFDHLGVPQDILASGLVAKYESYERMKKMVQDEVPRRELLAWQYQKEVLRAFIVDQTANPL